MTITELFNDPTTYTRAQDMIIRHSTVVRQGIDDGDVLEWFGSILQTEMRDNPELVIRSSRGYTAKIVTYAVKNASLYHHRDQHTKHVPLSSVEHYTTDEPRDVELSDKVAAAFQQLTPIQQVAIERRYIDGWFHSELRAEYGGQKSTWESHCKRGLRKLRKILGTTPPIAGRM